MWPEIRSQAMALLQEKYPESEFLEAIVSHTDLSNEVKWIEEAGYGKVVAEFQILKQIQEPFCEYLETKNIETLEAVIFRLADMTPVVRSRAMSIMQETYPDYFSIESVFARFDESQDSGFLKSIVNCLNHTANVCQYGSYEEWIGQGEWIEEAGGRENASMSKGGSLTASSSMSTRYLPVNAFRSGDGAWWSDPSNHNQRAEYIERTLPCSATPFIFAMQNDQKVDAPNEFQVKVKGDVESQWKTVLEAKRVRWSQDKQWQFWVLEKRLSLKAFRVVMKGCNNSLMVSVGGIRLFC